MEAIRSCLRGDFAPKVDFVLKDDKCENLGLRFEKLLPDVDVRADHGYEHKDAAINIFGGYKMTPAQRGAYRYAFNAWKNSMAARLGKDTICLELTSLTKMILGAGNGLALDFGFQLNKPWGVPYISGTTIKGLLSSYLARHGGEEWSRAEKTSIKSEYQVEIFGGSLNKGGKNTAYSGSVVFNDAWIDPDSNNWFVPDIITVHHQEYYQGNGANPDGMKNPVPVKILALNSGLKFFLTLQGDPHTLEFLKDVLAQALREEGVGSKTAVGYGRMECIDISERLQEAEERRINAQREQEREVEKAAEKAREQERQNERAQELAAQQAQLRTELEGYDKGSIDYAITKLKLKESGDCWDYGNKFLSSASEAWDEKQIELAKAIWPFIRKEKVKNFKANKANLFEKIKKIADKK